MAWASGPRCVPEAVASRRATALAEILCALMSVPAGREARGYEAERKTVKVLVLHESG